jgi:cytoskeleton protein RodZ
MAEIGSTLREARMRAHIDISEVEASTKIRAKYLLAIENEEWDLLPGAVYVKSFLRTYADYLGLDSRLLIDEFKRRYERPADHEVRPISGLSRDRDRSPRERSSRRRPSPSFSISPRVVIAAALVVIVAALYVLGSSSNSGNTTGNDGIVSPNSGHHKKPTTSGHGHEPKTNTNTSTTRTSTGATTPAVVPKATLALVATGTIWVCVEGPAHKLLIPGLEYVPGGKKIQAVSAKKLWVDLGNADATATVNGKPYTLPASSATGIGLVISPAGVKADPSPPKCNA